MTILDKIIAKKAIEVEQAKAAVNLSELERKPLFTRSCLSLHHSMRDRKTNGIIAEYKRASPSKGIINDHSSVEEGVRG